MPAFTALAKVKQRAAHKLEKCNRPLLIGASVLAHVANDGLKAVAIYGLVGRYTRSNDLSLQRGRSEHYAYRDQGEPNHVWLPRQLEREGKGTLIIILAGV